VVVAAVPVLFLTVFFAYPVGSIVARGLGDGSVLAVLRRRSTGRLLWFTTWQALVSTAATFLVGLPAAWVIARRRVPGRRFLRALLVVPFVLPTLVVAAALRAVFDAFGSSLDPSVTAIVLAHVVLNTAVVIRIVGGYWALLDDRVEDAARVLGAGRLRTFREVTLPGLAPALWSAAVIVFLFCFTSFGVILALGGPAHPTLETEIWRQATQRTDFTAAAALAVVQLVVVIALVAVANTLERRVVVRGGRPVAPAPLGTPRRRVAAALALAPSVLLLVVPVSVLVERSLATGGGHGFDNYRALGRSSTGGLFVPAVDAITNSLRYAVMATAVAVVVGATASAVVVGARRGRLLDVGLMVPLGTSAVTVGFGMLLALGRPPLDLRDSSLIVPLAQALVGIPFVVRSLVPALRAVDPRLREAAAVLGASPRRARLAVDGPIALRGLLVGAAFSFAISLGEFGATSFLARPDRPTVPVAMFRLLGRPGAQLHGQAMALGTVLVVLTACSVLVIERLRPSDAAGW
jgi:thiamine transport system permease protein